MTRFILRVGLCMLFLLPHALLAQSAQPDAEPVNPDATPAARALLRQIDALSGRGTLSGQHNYPYSVSQYSDRVYELTGHYPAVFGQDFGFSGGEDKDSTLGRPAMIAEVIRQYHSGAVIALTWHAVRPTEDEPVTFHESILSHLTDWEFHQVLTPGTDLYNRWARQVDVIAGYLQELQAAGVPVLFRPYHEMNGNWFWWGGRPGTGPNGTAALYRQIYDRYVHLHHLNNLIWVWNVNSPSVNAGPVDQYFPGSAYADIISMDIYGTFEASHYDSMVALAGSHKPIALAEVGALPTLEVLAAQPRWTYFMMWSGMAEGSNSPAQLQAVFHAPNVIHRGDARLAAPMSKPSDDPVPADHDSTPAARTLFASLYAGQTQSPGASVKRPEVVEFALSGAVSASVVEEIRSAAKAGKVPLLRWTPSSPTGSPLPVALTDFEWSELIRRGTALNMAWEAEVDSLASILGTLSKEHIAVLWSPLPENNTRAYWWSSRPGPDGSRALLRDVRERLVGQHHLHNLVWLWETALTSPVPGTPRPAGLEEFYPGPLGVDALMLNTAEPSSVRGFGARGVQALAAGKPVGLRTTIALKDPTLTPNFAWIDEARTTDEAAASSSR